MNKPVHETLREIMNEKNLSIAETARICNLPDSTVRGIITRFQKSVALEVAFKLSKGLGVSLERLNGGEELKKSPDPEEPETEDFDEEEFQLFCKAMVTLGYLREGEDFTDTQVQVLAGIIQILDATFPRFADGQLDEARTAG
ncbi:helix-turn-helix domain-containing protein [Anaeromassilibacillus senegalensis]|uniref:helix-turn-helix domain-containing protein n=1 Tax=Anaeromassilibacillus senegalensis TaxID=1673717 RepID=UPI0006817E09|nr:helix-turn-helix transcriptional regulator [Anaeromassilibacillus senegalensis]